MCKSVSTQNNLFNQLDRWVVRLILRFQWKRNEKLVQERIQVFEATEDDSAWQLVHAASQIEDPKIKAELFFQSLEEAHHSEVFRGLYEENAGKKLKKISVERKPIFQKEAPWKLFAYCSVGEAAAASRFRHIADHLEPGNLQKSLSKILAEEEGHIELAQDLASLTGRDAQEVKKEVRKIRLQRAWEAWLRAGRKITLAFSRLLLSGTYFAIGWWLKPKEIV